MTSVDPASSNPPSPEPIPRAFGRLWLLRRLARGGMGEVYLAASHGIEGAERPCVVKIIRSDHATDKSFVARFLDEARVQAQLQHPAVAQILEAAIEPGGEPFVVVEYVEGKNLAEVRGRAVQRGVTIDWAAAVAIGASLAEALAHAHERTDSTGKPLGIVHRDLSPQNVMLGYGGDLKLIDFGTARAENRRCRTVSGIVYAKPGYVAPEIANGDPGDFRVDLYAFGVIFWELLAGRRFLQGDAAQHLAAVGRGERVPPPIAEAVGAPLELDRIIARLVAHDPAERFESSGRAALELVQLLARAPSLSSGDRGVRARIARLLGDLYPTEPARSRAEFARLLAEARTLAEPPLTVLADPFPRDALGGPGREIRVEAAPELANATTGPRREDAPSVARGGESRPTGERLLGTPYHLLRLLGRGSAGIVYEAVHVELLRKVAVKVTEQAASPEVAEAFRREARALARLSHPNLVGVHEFGQSADGRMFCAMELVAGETVEHRLLRGPFAWKQAVSHAIEACRGLEAAHAAGVLHRDLSPQNILLCEAEAAPATSDRRRRARVKLVDFGLARASSEAGVAASGARSGAEGESSCSNAPVRMVGTPEYMAPEQAGAGLVDERADLYALACILYELCTGVRPFSSVSSVALIEEKRAGAHEPMRKRAPEQNIPASLDRLVARALCPDPARRPASVTELRVGLEGILRRSQGFGAASRFGLRLGAASAALFVAGALLMRTVGHAGLEVRRAEARSAFRLGGVDWARRLAAGVGSIASVGSSAPDRTRDVMPADAKTIEPSGGSPPPMLASVALSLSGPSAASVALSPSGPSVAGERGDGSGEGPREGRRRLPGAAGRPLGVEASSRPGVRAASSRTSALHADRGRAAAAHTDLPVPSPIADPYERMFSDALARLGEGDAAGSLERFRALARAYPSDAPAQRGWADAAAAVKDWAEARRAADRWRLVDAGSEPRLFLARVERYAGMTDQALVTLRELLDAHPECDEARAMLADWSRAP